jgi:hypothetical protein
MEWTGLQNIKSKQFTCGYCNNVVASSKGYSSQNHTDYIYICPHCKKPTSVKDEIQIPGVAPGQSIKFLPKEIESIYTEARNCISVSAFTSAVLILRKLLMNLAVSQGADEGKSFLEYVNFLSDAGYVPPNGKVWVDHIRKRGNEATHEIKVMTKDDAIDLIIFSEMFLKFIYEFPNRIPNTT